MSGIRTMKQIVLAVLIGLSLVVVPAWAQDNPGNLGNPGIVPPQASFGGQTYSEWVASLFQWVFSIPFTNHPLFDAADCVVGQPTGCSIGQSGNVWFLDGRLGSGGSVNRCCTIPAGTALFLMITGSEFDNASCDPTNTFVQLVRWIAFFWVVEGSAASMAGPCRTCPALIHPLLLHPIGCNRPCSIILCPGLITLMSLSMETVTSARR